MLQRGIEHLTPCMQLSSQKPCEQKLIQVLRHYSNIAVQENKSNFDYVNIIN